MQKLLRPDFNLLTTYKDESSGALVMEFWGNGVNDSLLTSQLADVPKDQKLVLSFRCTRVDDAGIQSLAGFPDGLLACPQFWYQVL